MYQLATMRRIGKDDIDSVSEEDLKRDYHYMKENGEKGINIYQKMQEDILHQLTLGGLTSGQLENFLEAWQNVKDLDKASGDALNPNAKKYQNLATARANVIRLLASIEANSPGK